MEIRGGCKQDLSRRLYKANRYTVIDCRENQLSGLQAHTTAMPLRSEMIEGGGDKSRAKESRGNLSVRYNRRTMQDWRLGYM
jgi:hypothetical protein